MCGVVMVSGVWKGFETLSRKHLEFSYFYTASVTLCGTMGISNATSQEYLATKYDQGV